MLDQARASEAAANQASASAITGMIGNIAGIASAGVTAQATVDAAAITAAAMGNNAASASSGGGSSYNPFSSYQVPSFYGQKD
jgi:predicted lipid-binding transport protein (Tim44 family)